MIDAAPLFIVLNPAGDDVVFWYQRIVTYGQTARLFCLLIARPRTKKELVEVIPNFRNDSGGFFNRLAHYFEKHKLPFVVTRTKTYGSPVRYYIALEPATEKVT